MDVGAEDAGAEDAGAVRCKGSRHKVQDVGAMRMRGI